jgi:hypothetical protein
MKQTIIILLLGFVLAQDNSLDFTDGYATIPMNGALANLDTYTIEFFSYFTNAGYDEHILGDDWFSDQIYFSTLSTSLYFLRTATTTSTITENTWQHIAGVRDGNTVYLFIDGVLVSTETYDITGNPGIGDWSINHHTWSGGSSSRSEGQIDEFRISSTARYTTEFTVPTEKFSNDASTVALWHFDEGSGSTSTDQSGNGYDVTFQSNASWSTNTPGLSEPTSTTNTYSLSFDGVDDYVDISVSTADDFTVLCWIKFETANNSNAILSSSGSDFIRIDAANGNQIGYNSPSGANHRGNSVLSENVWYHIAVIKDGSSLLFYLDGDLDGVFDESTNLLNWTTIGNVSGASHYWDGYLDEISIWSVPLSQNEIQSYLTTSLSGIESGLISYWNFNEGTGALLTDQTFNGNDGTIYGATWSTDVPFEGSVSIEEISAVISVGEANAYVIESMYTDTVLVPVLIDSLSAGISAGEFRFTGFQDGIEFLEVETDNSLMGDAGWSVVTNDQDTVLITAGYGSTDIDTSGILFFLKVAVSDTLMEGIASIETVEIELNESSDEITVHDGGINIFNPMLGDVSENDDVSVYDASLVLKYLVETEALNYPQMLSADVTFDGEITALDASVIAQYAVELIDTLPQTNTNLLAGMGDFGIDDNEFTPGEILQVPIQLINGSNLLSFEMELNFDPDILSYSGIEFSEMVDHFMTEENQINGSLKLAGAGATPDGQEGMFAIVSFLVGNDIENETIEIGIDHYRTNENEMQNGTSATFTNSTLAVDADFIPNDFALHQNYPNPFNPVTTINYDLPEQAHVSIMIYDIMGRKIRHLVNGIQEPGFKTTIWDASNNLGEPVSAGMYLYRIQTDRFSKTMKMVLLK